MAIDYQQREIELENETVAVLLDAVAHGDLQPATLRRNLALDEAKAIETDNDLRYRIAVRRRVLAILDETNN